MEILNISKGEIHYPVGYNFQNNLPTIMEMIKVFKSSFLYKKILKEKARINFICGGSSGSIIATVFAQNIPNSYIHYVRKGGEIGHNHYSLRENRYNIIVDDFTVTGETIKRLVRNSFKDDKENEELHAVILSGIVNDYRFIDKEHKQYPKLLICTEYIERK